MGTFASIAEDLEEEEDLNQTSSKKQNDKTKSEQETRYEEVLFHGYIRQTQPLLSNIIPAAITHIIWMYYYNTDKHLLFYLPFRDDPAYCVNIIGHNNHKINECKIFELNRSPLTLSTKLHGFSWRVSKSSLCTAENVTLPQLITNKICKLYNKYYKFSDIQYSMTDHHQYTMIFMRGGNHSTVHRSNCYAIAFDEREVYKHTTSDIIGFKWELPPVFEATSQLLFSTQYGLLSIGGHRTAGVWNLSFNKDTDWKWKCIVNMRYHRKEFASIMIDKRKYVMVTSGGTSEVINLNTKQIATANCKQKRYQHGIAYCHDNKRVFIAGGGSTIYGRDVLQSVEYCDMYRNTWYLFSNLPLPFDRWPVLWTTNAQILHICDSSGNFASIDLRANITVWREYNNQYMQIKSINKQYRVI